MIWFAAIAFPGAAGAQRLGQGSNPEVSFVRLVAALIVCLAVALLAVLLLRAGRSGAALPRFLLRLKAQGSAIEIAETRRISLHADVCLMRHGTQEYLLLIGQGHSRVLAKRTIPQAGEPEA